MNNTRVVSPLRALLASATAATLVLTPGLGCKSSNQKRGLETAQPGLETKQDPWALPPPPPKSVYDGPLFAMSHDYPKTPVAPPADPPWRKAINNGPITTANAEAYTQALKDHVAADMRVLLFDYPNWNAAKAGWYNAPWLTNVREPIHGTYVGSSFPPEMFPISGLKTSMTTHVLVYYDEVAATILQGLWGESGMNPVPGINAGKAQYPEGSIIIKPAFTTASAEAWPVVAGTQEWDIYAKPGDGSGDEPPVLQKTQFFQFDIIVKDTASSPKTQWVFTTLVYDKDAPGDVWDKMVPLGAMWGDDPNVNSPQGCDAIAGECPPLAETWINPKAPVYAKETLGWGGRLSGPNDGAVDISAAVAKADGTIVPYNGRYAMSSCMSCHNAAEYEMESFLLPSSASCKDDQCSPTLATCENGTCTPGTQPGKAPSLVYLESGTPEFMRWFTNRAGYEPMDPDTKALDYGMNVAFKALPTWYEATHGDELNFVEEFNYYRGHSRRVKKTHHQAP